MDWFIDKAQSLLSELWVAMDRPGIYTEAVRAGTNPEQWQDWDVMPTISSSVIFKQVGPGEHKRYDYSRLGNPTRKALEDAMAELDNGKEGLVFSSGSAAIVATVYLLSAGDHIVALDDLYPGTMVYFSQFINRMNIATTYVDGTIVNNILSAIRPNTKMIWLETITNPKLKLVDIAKISKEVKKLNKEILVVVDNTFITPCYVRPLDLGADICLLSCSKYINGHHDVILGSLTTNRPELYKQLKFIQQTLGGVPPAADCYQVIRSIKTLPLRMERHFQNGLAVAKFLKDHPKIEFVTHPLLDTYPQKELTLSQNRGKHSGMVSCKLSGNAENARAFLVSLKVCLLATSLGGVCTNIAVPGSMTTDGLDPEMVKKRELGTNFLRISVGLEDINDIIDDLKQALDKAFA